MGVAFLSDKARCIRKAKPVTGRQIKLDQIARPDLGHFCTRTIAAEIRKVAMVFTPDNSPVFNLIAPDGYTVHDVSLLAFS